MSSISLTNIQTEINFYGYSIFMIFGNIGNLFIVILFNRQRQNACSLYLINSAIVNIIYLTVGGFLKIFSFSYNDGTTRALILCKFSSYIPGVLGQVTKMMIVFACIDRYLITSNRATFRAFSTPKRAKYLIFFTYIFWVIAAVHMPICITISNGQCTKIGLYITLYALYAILFIGLIPSIILCVFGYLTYKNIRQMRNRIQPIAHNINNSIQRRDRDLLVLVIAEAVIYIITTTLFPLVHLEIMISQYVISTKSLQYIQAENFALNIAFLLIFIFSALPFYIYLISSASFRQDFKKLIMNGYRKLRKQPSNQIAARTGQVVTQHETRV